MTSRAITLPDENPRHVGTFVCGAPPAQPGINPHKRYKALFRGRRQEFNAMAATSDTLYEQRRVHHAGQFPMLEDRMLAFTSDFDRGRAGYGRRTIPTSNDEVQ